MPVKVLSEHREMGRSSLFIEDACGQMLKVYLWSIAGKGKRCPGCGKDHSNHFRPCPVCGERKFSVSHVLAELLAAKTKSRKEFHNVASTNLFALASALRGHEALAELSKFMWSKDYTKRRMRSALICKCTILCKHGALKGVRTSKRLRPRGSKVYVGWEK